MPEAYRNAWSCRPPAPCTPRIAPGHSQIGGHAATGCRAERKAAVCWGPPQRLSSCHLLSARFAPWRTSFLIGLGRKIWTRLRSPEFPSPKQPIYTTIYTDRHPDEKLHRRNCGLPPLDEFRLRMVPREILTGLQWPGKDWRGLWALGRTATSPH